MNRVVFLVDGFNVYHSVREAVRDGGGSLKWLDLLSLCQSYVNSGLFGKTAKLEAVTYFSAYATFLTPSNPGVVVRHRTYVSALEASGVELVMGRFKWKPRWCPKCRTEIPGHEEKETDVSIAVRMLELAVGRQCETIVVVTGDTDLLPALRSTRRLAPDVQLWIAAPYRRMNEELRTVADGHIKIRRAKYGKHQFPDPIVLPDGSKIAKPPGW